MQTAYQTATGKRKVATAAVTKGSGIHQALGKKGAKRELGGRMGA